MNMHGNTEQLIAIASQFVKGSCDCLLLISCVCFSKMNILVCKVLLPFVVWCLPESLNLPNKDWLTRIPKSKSLLCNYSNDVWKTNQVVEIVHPFEYRKINTRSYFE